MKVGLNATCLNDRPSGAKQRFVGIYSEVFAQAPDVEFVVYEPVDCEVARWFEGAPNVTGRKTPVPSEGRLAKLARGWGYWRAELANQRFDIFEGFNLPFIAAPGACNLLTLHDFRGLLPETPTLQRLLFRSVLGRALRAADHVVTVSQAMKSALVEEFPGVQATVVYNGLGSDSFARRAPAELAEFKARLSVSPGYLLAVGHLEPRKNYPRLVDAVARVNARGVAASLLIIGNDSGERAEVERRVQAAGLEGRVQVLSGLSDIEVRCAYELCGLFVFPSTYEGFGIPILEAMAAGRPMVVSDLEVFREITEHQGVYFPPTDEIGMADAIERVLGRPAEQTRLVEYGKRRLADFGYGQLAGKILALHRSVVR